MVRFAVTCAVIFLTLGSWASAAVPFDSTRGVTAKYMTATSCMFSESRPFEFEVDVYGLTRPYNAVALITQTGHTSVFLATSALGDRMTDGGRRYRFYVENNTVSATAGSYRLGLVLVSADPADLVQTSTGTSITNGARADVIDCTVTR
ncbi:MAG TPA: hypothetical protein VME66_02000 [Candidatus Acidoferrales bacterium]|nr:hypothetical protein [Candidatus Acidoferrales bacterium]